MIATAHSSKTCQHEPVLGISVHCIIPALLVFRCCMYDSRYLTVRITVVDNDIEATFDFNQTLTP